VDEVAVVLASLEPPPERLGVTLNRPGFHAVFWLVAAPVGSMSVVGLFELFGCGVVEQAVQALVGVPVDVGHGDRFDVSQGAWRAGAER
jgi:hypothetical protein